MQEKQKISNVERARIEVENACDGKYLPTATQLRKIFSHINKIKNNMEVSLLNDSSEVYAKKLYENLQYFKVQLIYQMGRDAKVKNFIENTQILKKLDGIKGSNGFSSYCRYMEAIIAYQKYYGKEK